VSADVGTAAFLDAEPDLGRWPVSVGLSNVDACWRGGGGDELLENTACVDGGGLGGGSIVGAGEVGRDLAGSRSEDGGHMQTGDAQGMHADSGQVPPACLQGDEWFAMQAQQLKEANDRAKQQIFRLQDGRKNRIF
jgi:hypothetical protein